MKRIKERGHMSDVHCTKEPYVWSIVKTVNTGILHEAAHIVHSRKGETNET